MQKIKPATAEKCSACRFFIKNCPKISFYNFNPAAYNTNANAKLKRGEITMAKNVVPEAKDALNRFKMEAANEVGVNLKQGYNGDLTSKQAGSVGGQMVKKMIEAYENSMK